MEVDMDDGSKPKLDQDVMKPTCKAGSSGSLVSDTPYHDNENDDNDMDDDDGDDEFDYDDDDDYTFDNDKDEDDDDDDDDDESDYLSMQAQFDNVDLPPGVEASFSWLNNPPPVASTTTVSQTDSTHNDIASSSSSVLPNITSSSAVEKEVVAEEEEKKKKFKSFDIVADFSDHHYNDAGFHGQQPPRTWTKKIQDEWKILEKDLPDTIFVRAYETRMDLLRAVIVGPAGTPYHDGLFVFDINFPPSYPDIPPMVYYYSGGLRLNPNLYDNGKVCLSLLNTWTGRGTEKWIPNKSTMLQVLVSIQALILNDKPFFNEPGYDSAYPGVVGDQKSKEYNENAFILSLKTMVYTVRRPPKHFEDLVVGHFRGRAELILTACKAYMDGVQVGSMVGIIPDNKSVSKQFRADVAKMVNGLVSNFTRCGAANCEQFRV